MKYQIMVLSQVLMLATLANARFLIFSAAAVEETAFAPSRVQMAAALPTQSSVASEEPSTLNGSSVSAFKSVVFTVTHYHHHHNGTLTQHRNGTASDHYYTGTAIHDHHNATATHHNHNGTITHHCTGIATHSHHHQSSGSGSGFASGSGRNHVTRSFSHHSRPSSLPGFTTLSGVPVLSASGGFAVDQASNTPSPSKASPASTTTTMSTLTTGGGYYD